MTPQQYRLFLRLADGMPHSGDSLAEAGVSRTAVWKQINALRRLGLPIVGQAGDGYRLECPIEPLDESRIRAAMTGQSAEIEVMPAVGSTNAELSRRQQIHRRAVLAETQTAGRGRRGRGWLSPPGAGVFASLGWRFDIGLSGLGGLSLIAGLAAAEAIKRIADFEIGLKWPNDLVVDGHKLGGCLVEVSGPADGPCIAILGVGINLRLPQEQHPDQPWTDLHSQGMAVGRNALAGALIDALATGCEQLGEQGLEAFSGDWARHDILYGREVECLGGDGQRLTGTADGIDEQGRLRLLTPDGLQSLSSAEVSVRAR